jgi:bifunctional non-homologous end joining protein LigD
MSLSLYNSKRHFNDTPEPKGKTKSSKGSLRFVIQKHDASHLHYDLRLEMEGVLKSWAVPKGPSVNPEDKRLAMMVEDHPFDYRDFEGIIPEGNYGAGTVIVWDEGFYEPVDHEGLSRKEKEKILLQQLHSGNIKIEFHGEKLKGEYALFLMKGKGDRSWILMKKSDDYSSEKDITKLNKSVKTGKTIADVAKENGTVPNHPEGRVKTSRKSPPIQLLDQPPVKRPASKKSASKKTAPKKKSAGKVATKRPAGKKAASSKKKVRKKI